VGHPDGIYLPIPSPPTGETRGLTIPHGGELPTEIDGHKVPASFRDSLLEQKDNWTEVKAPDKTTTAKAEKKEG
jgi:hypothetical protein